MKNPKTLKSWFMSLSETSISRKLKIRKTIVASMKRMSENMIDEDGDWWTQETQYKMAKAYVEYVEKLKTKNK